MLITISHLYTIFPFCIYIASILNAMYMHLKQTHLYAIRPTTRYITHSKNLNWSKCDVHRILNCDIYRIYFLNAMYVASACGVLQNIIYEGICASFCAACHWYGQRSLAHMFCLGMDAVIIISYLLN